MALPAAMALPVARALLFLLLLALLRGHFGYAYMVVIAEMVIAIMAVLALATLPSTYISEFGRVNSLSFYITHIVT